jgi:hypothetical protein
MSVVQRLLVDEWRDGLSILSSVVTVVGFGVAIWQMVRQATQLSETDSEWKELRDEIFQWASTYQRMACGDLKNTAKQRKNWTDFLLRLKRKLGEHHTPLANRAKGPHHDPPPRTG